MLPVTSPAMMYGVTQFPPGGNRGRPLARPAPTRLTSCVVLLGDRRRGGRGRRGRAGRLQLAVVDHLLRAHGITVELRHECLVRELHEVRALERLVEHVGEAHRREPAVLRLARGRRRVARLIRRLLMNAFWAGQFTPAALMPSRKALAESHPYTADALI